MTCDGWNNGYFGQMCGRSGDAGCSASDGTHGHWLKSVLHAYWTNAGTITTLQFRAPMFSEGFCDWGWPLQISQCV